MAGCGVDRSRIGVEQALRLSPVEVSYVDPSALLGPSRIEQEVLAVRQELWGAVIGLARWIDLGERARRSSLGRDLKDRAHCGRCEQNRAGPIPGAAPARAGVGEHAYRGRCEVDPLERSVRKEAQRAAVG